MRNEIKKIISFWMDQGIDGFRVDLAASLVKADPDRKATIALWQDLNAWFDCAYPNGVLTAISEAGSSMAPAHRRDTPP